LHHQIARLEIQNEEVARLEALVADTAANASSKDDMESLRDQVLTALDSKLGGLEERVALASFASEETRALREQLGRTRQEAALFKAQMSRDLSRTQEAVDAYHEEMRSCRHADNEVLERTRSDLQLLSGKID